jgi:di/tripeptidase
VLDGASIGHITAEGLGSRRFEIVIEGHGGHSWNDYGRANPIHAMGRIIALLADLELPASPRTTLSVGVVEGGSVVNSIAPVARAKVDIRSRSSSAMQQVVKALEETVKYGVEAENRRSIDRLSTYKLREIGHRPAAALIPGNPLVECLQAVDAVMGNPSRLDCASTDANVPLSMGLPAVAIGSGGRGGDAHTPTEWFHPEGRETGLRRVMLALGLMLDPATPLG